MAGEKLLPDRVIRNLIPEKERPLKKIRLIVRKEAQRQLQYGRRLRLMFQDEGRFGRINDPRRCWAPKGIRPQVGVQMVREYTYAYAAVSPHDGVMDSLIIPEANTEAMSYFLEEVSGRHPEEFILMVMDRAGWHRSRNLCIPENIGFLWLPAYSPQCNPVEHIWDEIREKWFPNRVFIPSCIQIVTNIKFSSDLKIFYPEGKDATPTRYQSGSSKGIGGFA